MSALPVMLADAELHQILGAWRFSEPGTVQALLIFGAIGLVILLLVIWAIFFRKQRRRRHSRHHSHHHPSEAAGASEVTDAEPAPLSEIPHHKRKRRRRRHRPRNPTLAETGGLPPIRPESPAEPPS